jgi:hypothetical protein
MSKYQMVVFARASLDAVTQMGFIPVRVGGTTCEGWVQKRLLKSMPCDYMQI